MRVDSRLWTGAVVAVAVMLALGRALLFAQEGGVVPASMPRLAGEQSQNPVVQPSTPATDFSELSPSDRRRLLEARYGVDRDRDAQMIDAARWLGAHGNGFDQSNASRLLVVYLKTEAQSLAAGSGDDGLLVALVEAMSVVPSHELRGRAELVLSGLLSDPVVPFDVRKLAARTLAKIGGVRAHAYLVAYRNDLHAALRNPDLASGGQHQADGASSELLPRVLREVEESIASLP
jgi:hypothetical protein